jgi:hypothetical protein
VDAGFRGKSASANQWRDMALVNLNQLAFDELPSNGPRILSWKDGPNALANDLRSGACRRPAN